MISGNKDEVVWACGHQSFKMNEYEDGPTCKDDENIIFVWAKDAGRLDLPQDVVFELKGGSELVLAIHYKGLQNGSLDETPGIVFIEIFTNVIYEK